MDICKIYRSIDSPTKDWLILSKSSMYDEGVIVCRFSDERKKIYIKQIPPFLIGITVPMFEQSRLLYTNEDLDPDAVISCLIIGLTKLRKMGISMHQYTNRYGVYLPYIVHGLAKEALDSVCKLSNNRDLLHHVCRVFGSKRMPNACDKLIKLNKQEADKRYYAKKASIIQRAYLEAISNPYTELCRNRLMREFQSLSEEIQV